MKIQQALDRLFQTHRIVFWYDEKKELRAEYESLDLAGVEKVELKNNEFGVKYRLLRDAPLQKFLLYHDGPRPADLDNWLLDVLLAQAEFRADQVSLWLSELGLGPEFWEIGQDHPEFFKAPARLAALKARLDKQDPLPVIRLKMLAVCVNAQTEPRLDAILEMLLDELAEERDERIKLINRAGLEGFLWSRVERHFGYRSTSPGVRDFAIALFQAAYALGLEEPAPLNAEALVFLQRWKDSRRFHRAFETLSDACAGFLTIENDLQPRPARALVELDAFRLIDQKILVELVQGVIKRTLAPADCAALIRRRRTTHWFDDYHHLYEAVDQAAHFIAELGQASLSLHSLADGLAKYAETWYRLDQRYRKFIYHTRAAGRVALLQPLLEQIEALYSNNFLLKVNDTWQQAVDAASVWAAPPMIAQTDFFEQFVRPFLPDNKKVTVIISDALRYEIAAELLERVETEDRYSASLTPMLSVLPSYTQLGMAALLPHQRLTLLADGTVQVDGQSSQGADNRAKILNGAVPGGAVAIRAEELLALSRADSRALFRDHQVIYVYHNQIDATGDKRDAEEQVFEAAERALDEIITLIKKLANANVTNMLVTADHGFIFQHHPLDESDFSGIEISGGEIETRNRRFILGRRLPANAGVKHFTAQQVGLSGELELLIPKSINRLRVKGAGSRYVHGGAALQEVVVPVLRINKKRQSDLEQVGIDILRSPTSVISTGQVAVAFYQTEPVSAKRQPRKLRAGIYTQSGALISDRHDLIFDLASDNPRGREVSVRFVLSRNAEQANEQEVFLKLEEQIPDTSHYQEYKSVRYILRRSFTSDFDF